MSRAELSRLFSLAGHPLQEGGCLVATYGERTQRIAVEEENGYLRLTTKVATAADLERAELGHRECWERNRLAELVGLRIDRRGTLLAEVWLPLLGIDAELVKLVVRHLAITGDRLEHQLSGKDQF